MLVDVLTIVVKMTTYLGFDYVPLLACSSCETTPDLLSHSHVLLSQTLKLEVVPIISTLAFQQSLVTLAACIGSLGGKVIRLDLLPVQALHPRSEKLLVICSSPGTRTGSVLDRRRDGNRWCGGCSVGFICRLLSL